MTDIRKQISYRNSPAFKQTNDIADPLLPTKMRGYLRKKGEMVQNWKRRYLRLKCNTLFYYLG